jgi:hypothetical protein
MAPDHGSKVDISFAGRFTASAIAACFAEVLLNPNPLAPSSTHRPLPLPLPVPGTGTGITLCFSPLSPAGSRRQSDLPTAQSRITTPILFILHGFRFPIFLT